MAADPTLVELASELVRIDSINPDLEPGAAGEGEIARFVAEWLRAAGLDVTIEDASPGRPNVIGVARGSGGGRSLMLNAHMDTVGVTGMEAPFEPFVRDGCLHGRGAGDMKGSLAAIMQVGAAAVRLGLRGDVIVTAVADEEVASIGTEAVVARWRADAAIVSEPTEEVVVIAHKGFVSFEIQTDGVAAHGSRPDLGVDAIAAMGPILSGIRTLDTTLQAGERHPLLGTGSLHASVIEGGRSTRATPRAVGFSVSAARSRASRSRTSGASSRSSLPARGRRLRHHSIAIRSRSISTSRSCNWCSRRPGPTRPAAPRSGPNRRSCRRRGSPPSSTGHGSAACTASTSGST